MSALVREAQLSALRTSMESEANSKAGTATTVEKAAFISKGDFEVALTRVFPSVSKRDELVYARLQGTLRKTRGHIEEEK